MSLSSSVQKWLHLPSRIALLLGFGALSATAAQANATEIELGNQPDRVPQQSAKSFGQLAIWSDGGRIFVSDSGKPAQELRLGDTTEARQLRQILQREGAAADSPRVLPDRIILVGGGGAGISWTPPNKDRTYGTPDGSAATGFGSVDPRTPTQKTPPANSGYPGKASATRTPQKG